MFTNAVILISAAIMLWPIPTWAATNHGTDLYSWTKNNKEYLHGIFLRMPLEEFRARYPGAQMAPQVAGGDTKKVRFATVADSPAGKTTIQVAFSHEMLIEANLQYEVPIDRSGPPPPAISIIDTQLGEPNFKDSHRREWEHGTAQLSLAQVVDQRGELSGHRLRLRGDLEPAIGREPDASSIWTGFWRFISGLAETFVPRR